MLAYHGRGTVTREINLRDLGPSQDLVHDFVLFSHSGAIADAVVQGGCEVDMASETWCLGCYC
jgi:hypothetical protein